MIINLPQNLLSCDMIFVINNIHIVSMLHDGIFLDYGDVFPMFTNDFSDTFRFTNISG